MSYTIKHFLKSDYILFFLIFAVLVWAFFVLPPLSLYSNDEGAKYVQMKNFYLNKSLAIKYPGEKLGLDLSYLLKEQSLFAQREGRLFCTYPPLFTYLSSLFYPLFGDRVTHFLPLLAFFLSLLVLSRILKLLIKKTFLYYFLLLTFLLGSPIFLYSFTFWEHLPAVFGVVCSLYFLVRYFCVKASKLNIFLSAFVLSLASFFRTEIIFLIIAYTISFGLILYIHRKLRDIAALITGAAAPLIVYAIFNFINYQDILGLHILYNSPNFRLSIDKIIISLGVFFVCTALVFISKRDKLDPALKQEIFSFIPVLWLGFEFAVFWRSPIPNLFLAFPAVLLVFFGISNRIEMLKHKDWDFGNLIFGTVVLFVWLVSYFLFNNPDLAARYCLPIIPLIIIFIASEQKRIFIAKSIFGVLLVFFLFSLSYGLHKFKNNIWKYKWYNTERIEFLKKYTHRGDVVIFQNNRFMEHAGPLFFERIYSVSEEPDELAKIFNLLKSKGITHCYYWTFNPDYFSQKGNYKTMRYDFEKKGFPYLYLFKVHIE